VSSPPPAHQHRHLILLPLPSAHGCPPQRR
jgi:hypothetical protein